MKYVAVLSSQPGADVYTPIFNYFDDYLITLGEVTAGNAKKMKQANWTLMDVLKHANKIIKTNKVYNKHLYIDSAGFQVIMGHITISRLSDYIQCYHEVILKFKDDIHKIFSLDINNIDFTRDQILKYNDLSINESINIIKKYPEIKDKQLFVVQSRNTYVFKIWKELMLKHNVFEYFNLWSIGGLVNLKKETNADFSHAVPITLWLIAYSKKYNGNIKQVHWLGQSSRLAFISMALFEKVYNIHMTSDSSQLIRFAPIEHKMPFMSIDNTTKEFKLAMDHDTIEEMFTRHSLGKEHADMTIKKFRNYTLNNSNFETDHEEEEFSTEELAKINDKNINKIKSNKNNFSMDNEDIIELQSQNIFYEIQFANMVVEKLTEQPLEYWNTENIKEIHPILARGRIAKEIINNLSFFIKFKPIIENGDLDLADKIMIGVTESYLKE